MQLNTFRRGAAAVVTAALLSLAGQGTAWASDPQWEAAPLKETVSSAARLP